MNSQPLSTSSQVRGGVDSTDRIFYFAPRFSVLLGLSIFLIGQSLHGASILIPVANRVDHVYDPTRNLLYITATDGTIQRWSVASKTLLSPYTVGVNLSGIDITPDGAFAYAGESVAGVTDGFVRKVNLNDGTRTNISYPIGGGETGVVAVRMASNGKVLFTTNFAGSGDVPLHIIDVATDTVTSPRNVTQSTGIASGPDRSLLFFQEGNISSGPIFTYTAATNTFANDKDTSSYVGSEPAAVNRNGTLIAFKNSLLNPALNTVDIVPGSIGGYQFDPFRDILYVADTATDSVRAYNSSTLSFLGQISIGQDITGDNRMSISSDTKYLFVTTSTGVRMLDNTFAIPEPTTIVLFGMGAILNRPRRRWAAKG